MVIENNQEESSRRFRLDFLPSSAGGQLYLACPGEPRSINGGLRSRQVLREAKTGGQTSHWRFRKDLNTDLSFGVNSFLSRYFYWL